MADNWDDSDVNDAVRIARQPSNLVYDNDVTPSYGDYMRQAGVSIHDYLTGAPSKIYQNIANPNTTPITKTLGQRFTPQGKKEALQTIAKFGGDTAQGIYNDTIAPFGQVYRGELDPEQQQFAAMKLASSLLGLGAGTSALSGAGEGAVLRSGMGPVGKATLPRRSGSLEEAVARAEARSRGEIPLNPASSVSQTNLGSLGPTPAANLSVGMGHNRPTTTTTLQELADQAGMTPRDYGSRFSKVLSRTPYEEWNYTHQPYRDMQERKIFDPQSMKTGDVIIPFFGDLTSAGRRITDINSNRLHFPTDTEGGEGYMRMTPDIWASGQSIVSGLANRAGAAVEESKKLGYENPDVYGVHVGMGPRSGDFSIHTAKALLGMLDPSRISASDVQKFNDFMKTQQISSAGKEVYKPFEDFPGLYSDELHDYLMKQGQGDARIKFSKGMDTSELLKRGFPDVGAARFATTEPLLGGLPTYSTGMSVGKLNMDNPVSKSPAVPVGSYPISMPGTYEGGFETPVYKDKVFRDFANAYNLRTPNATAPAKYKAYAGNTAYQIVDPELKDSLSEAMELAKRGRADGGEINDDIAHALRLATGGRAHFDDGGEASGEAKDAEFTRDYNSSLQGPSQNESLNAYVARQDPQRYTDPEANRLTAEERRPSELEGQAHFVPSGEGQSLFRDTSGEMTVGQNTRSDVAGPTANQIAAEQANQEENRAMAANAAMAQRAGVMTGQPTAPTFTGNTTEEQQLADAEASRQAAINAVITGANYTAPGTVSAADVVTPATLGATGKAFVDAANRGIAGMQGEPSYPKTDFNQFGQLGFNSNVAGTPRESLVAAEPQHYEPLGKQIAPSQDAVLSDALYKATTFEPSENAALRAIRDAIPQNLGPITTPQASSGLGSATPANLPAVKTSPQADTSAIANEAPRIPVNALEDPALIAAYNAQYNLSGPKNTRADMALGQRNPNVTTNNPLVNTIQGLSNFLTDRFTPSYNLGSDQYNKISQTPDMPTNAGENRGNRGEQIIQASPVAAPVAATPLAAPVVPGTPVPYTYAKRTPYLDYGAYGAGIGNVAPISYRDPINWALVPGYRATGGRVGENNALANVLRMLAQNRS
jgi:hypothetical protein